MKFFFTIIVTLISTGMFLSGCKKQTHPSPPPPPVPPVIPIGMSADVNGLLWVAQTDTALANSSFGVMGTDSTGMSISIAVGMYHKIDSYRIDGAFNSCMYFRANASIFAISTTGTLTITQASSTNVQGFFNAVAIDGRSMPGAPHIYKITNGQFNVPLR
jgi:hypothetical protein